MSTDRQGSAAVAGRALLLIKIYYLIVLPINLACVSHSAYWRYLSIVTITLTSRRGQF